MGSWSPSVSRQITRGNLWDATTDAFVARFKYVGHVGPAGPTVAVLQAWGSGNVVTVLSAVDGHLLTTIPQSESTFWFQLATDGSYSALGDRSMLRVYSPTGMPLYSTGGDYSNAQAPLIYCSGASLGPGDAGAPWGALAA